MGVVVRCSGGIVEKNWKTLRGKQIRKEVKRCVEVSFSSEICSDPCVVEVRLTEGVAWDRSGAQHWEASCIRWRPMVDDHSEVQIALRGQLQRVQRGRRGCQITWACLLGGKIARWFFEVRLGEQVITTILRFTMNREMPHRPIVEAFVDALSGWSAQSQIDFESTASIELCWYFTDEQKLKRWWGPFLDCG